MLWRVLDKRRHAHLNRNQLTQVWADVGNRRGGGTRGGEGLVRYGLDGRGERTRGGEGLVRYG